MDTRILWNAIRSAGMDMGLTVAKAEAMADHAVSTITAKPVAWRYDHIWPKGGKTSPGVTFDRDEAEAKAARPDRYKITPLYEAPKP